MKLLKSPQLRGQMDLFALLEGGELLVPCLKEKEEPLPSAAPVASDGDGSYLDKGEVLTTLARERFGEEVKRLSFSDAEKTLFQIPFNRYLEGQFVPKIASSLIRPLLRHWGEDTDGEVMDTLRQLGVTNVRITRVDAESASCLAAIRYLRRRLLKSDDLIRLEIIEDGFTPLIVYGYRGMAHSGRKDILFKDYTRASDIGIILSWLVLFAQYDKAMRTDSMHEAIREACCHESSSTSIAEKLGMAMTRDSSYIAKGAEFIQLFQRLSQVPWHLPQEKAERPSDAFLSLLEETLGVPGKSFAIADAPSEHLRRSNRIRQRSGKDLPACLLISHLLEWMAAEDDPVGMYQRGIGVPVYHKLVTLHEDTSWAFPNFNSSVGTKLYSLLASVLEIWWKEKGALAEQLSVWKSMDAKQHAKSFQTKAGIPLKILGAMEASTFNRYFGFVEFDERCDPEKLERFAKEFISFHESYLPGFATPKTSLRIRRLGNHKASGLYYPFANCLCVDLENPSSFIHEYGHCLDYLEGQLSLKSAFSMVRVLYERGITDALRKSGKVLKGKYSLKYYLTPTEVFARCFEMYVTRCLGLTSSLCKQEEDWAYPEDEKLMQQIKGYFDHLLQRFATVNETTEEAA